MKNGTIASGLTMASSVTSGLKSMKILPIRASTAGLKGWRNPAEMGQRRLRRLDPQKFGQGGRAQGAFAAHGLTGLQVPGHHKRNRFGAKTVQQLGVVLDRLSDLGCDAA